MQISQKDDSLAGAGPSEKTMRKEEREEEQKEGS